MNHSAFCPSCKRDVVFRHTDAEAVCPECGAAFELSDVSPAKRSFATSGGLLAVGWMFAPCALALAIVVLWKAVGTQGLSMRPFLPTAAITWGLATMVNSAIASGWLVRRLTRRTGLRVLVTLVLGVSVFFSNACIALFSGCALG